MEWLEWIIKIGGAGGIIITIWRVSVKLVHLFDEFKSDIKELKDHSKENYLGIKRLTVMSRDMPLGERIVAGDEYIKAGGNGEVKKYIEDKLHTKDVQKD